MTTQMRIHLLLSHHMKSNKPTEQQLLLAQQKLLIIEGLSLCMNEDDLKSYLTKVLDTFNTNVKLDRVNLKDFGGASMNFDSDNIGVAL